MVTEKRKEIKQLREEIRDLTLKLGGKVKPKKLNSNDLNIIDNQLSVLMFEQSGLANTPKSILSIKQKARLNFLNETIKNVSFQLRLDRADLKFKKNNKLVGNIHEGFSIQKIGKSKVTLFN